MAERNLKEASNSPSAHPWSATSTPQDHPGRESDAKRMTELVEMKKVTKKVSLVEKSLAQIAKPQIRYSHARIRNTTLKDIQRGPARPQAGEPCTASSMYP